MVKAAIPTNLIKCQRLMIIMIAIWVIVRWVLKASLLRKCRSQFPMLDSGVQLPVYSSEGSVASLYWEWAML